MQRHTALRLNRTGVIGLLAACLLVACTGGGEDLAGIQGSGSPVAAGFTSVGAISGFGSIILDGVEYTTSGAQVSIDGEPGTESQLRVGHVVTLKGTVSADGNTQVATEVSYTADLRGPVTQIDLEQGSFTVLGQNVQVTDGTSFDESFQPADLEGLQNGTVVQVSGFTDADGRLVASRIEPAAASTTLQVKGAVQGLDTSARTFRINELTVDYSGVSPNGMLAEGAIVLVRANAPEATGVLVATRVQVIPGLSAGANDRGQLEGVVTSFTSSSDFAVNGQRVTTNSSTELILRGATLGLNIPVKVRGAFDASGVLVASRIEIKPGSMSLLRAPVEAVSAAEGTLTVLGVRITLSANTVMEDRSTQRVRSFSLADLRVGDYVEVRGTPGDSGGLLASLLERNEPDDRVYARGVALDVAEPAIKVLGVPVMTDAQTQFLGLGAPAEAAAAFYGQVAGSVVNVRGTLNGGVLIADRVQIRRQGQ